MCLFRRLSTFVDLFKVGANHTWDIWPWVGGILRETSQKHRYKPDSNPQPGLFQPLPTFVNLVFYIFLGVGRFCGLELDGIPSIPNILPRVALGGWPWAGGGRYIWRLVRPNMWFQGHNILTDVYFSWLEIFTLMISSLNLRLTLIN